MPLATAGTLKRSHAPSILVVDDDEGTCDAVDWALAPLGFRVVSAGSGAEAFAVANSYRFDLMFVDFRLPDMLGTELARSLNQSALVPFVLISGFLSTDITVEAMRLGASTVLEKPITLDVFRDAAVRVLGDPSVRPHSCSTVGSSTNEGVVVPGEFRPRSVAERWAFHVLRACDSDADFRTLSEWAPYEGVSVSSLSETCRLVGVHPRDARDLARVLRVLMKSSGHRCNWDSLLDVRDGRTLKTLFERGGLTLDAKTEVVSLSQFLENQRFVPVDNEGLRVLRELLQLLAWTSTRQHKPGPLVLGSDD